MTEQQLQNCERQRVYDEMAAHAQLHGLDQQTQERMFELKHEMSLDHSTSDCRRNGYDCFTCPNQCNG